MELRPPSPAAAPPQDARAAAGVSRRGRVLDLAGALLFLTGGGVFVWAWLGFQDVSGYEPPPEDGAWAAVRLADQYWRLQKVATALMIAGIAVFVAAWWLAGRAGRRTRGPQA